MENHSKFNTARKLLLFWCLFISIGAFGGAICMFLAPDGSLLGMTSMLPYFQVLPFADWLFSDFTFPGIALICVNGIPDLAAAVLLLAKKKVGILLGGLCGLILMAWIVIQFLIFPANFMSTTFFIIGLLQSLTAVAAWHFAKMELPRI